MYWKLPAELIAIDMIIKAFIFLSLRIILFIKYPSKNPWKIKYNVNIEVKNEFYRLIDFEYRIKLLNIFAGIKISYAI